MNTSLSIDSDENFTIGRLARPAAVATPATSVWEVKRMMSEAEPLSAVVVVDGDVPVGLVMNLHLTSALSQLYGVSLYAHRPVRRIMDGAPLTVDARAPLESVASRAMQREKARIYDQIIVTQAGKLTGLVSVEDMLRTLAELESQRAKTMADVNAHLTREVATRKLAEQELTAANERLRELDKLKTEFLSMVSHELRTPLTSILGFTEINRDRLNRVIFPVIVEPQGKVQKAVAKVMRNMEIILTEGERLLGLISNLLDVAKLESGKMEFLFEPLDLNAVVDRAAAATAALIETKGLVLHTTLADGLPPILGDRDRMVQVVINLVSNAVKFTPAGQVTVAVSAADTGATLSVEDTGCGIAAEDLESVFERFRQVGDHLTDKPVGTGLGLTICRQIIEHHGGKIWAESCPGKGSRFSVFLPASSDPPPVQRRKDAENTDLR